MPDISEKHIGAVGLLIGLGASVAGAQVTSIPVQNNSFESPVIPRGIFPVLLNADDWVLNGPGPDYDLGQGMGPQNPGTGIFYNVPSTKPGYLPNMDGEQSAYIFTLSGNYFSQPLVDTSNSNAPIKFSAGQSYSITAAVANAEEAPLPGDQLFVGLYYTNASSQLVPVAQTIVMNDGTQGLTGAQFNDYSGLSGILSANDPAVGQQITVYITATGAGSAEFDFDNIRVSTTTAPTSLNITGENQLDVGTQNLSTAYIGGSSSGSGATGVLIINGGVLNTSGALTVYNSAGSTLNLRSGSVTASSLILNGTFSQSGGSATFGAITGAGQLNISGGTTVLSPSHTTSQLNTLTITGSGSLDLTSSTLQIASASLSTIQADIFTGYNNGAWNGPGIISSTALSDPGHGLGYAQNASGQVTIMYTLYGDATLDGTVNFSDLLALAANYTSTSADWAEGDFNYDGTVNFSDLLLLAQNYTATLSNDPGVSSSFAADWALAEAEVSSVPEPGAIGMVMVGAAILLRRKRNRNGRLTMDN